MKKNKPFSKFFLGLMFCFLYVPIIIVVIYSFNESRTIGHWSGFSLAWYEALFNNTAIQQSLFFTLFIAFVATFIATIIGTLGAIGLFYSKRKLQKLLLALNQIPLISPDIILGVSYMLLFLFIKLPFGSFSVLFAHIMFSTPVVLISIMPRLYKMDRDLIAAAEDLGANAWQTFKVAIFPTILPGIISGAILALTFSLDDFIVTYFTAGEGVSTLSMQIYTQIKRQVSPELNALSTLMLITVLLITGSYFIYNERKQKKEIKAVQK